MRRREFIKVIAGSAAWPLAAHAQQPDRMRRIGVLMALSANDPEGQARVAAFRRQRHGLSLVHDHRHRR
jgi:putative ABC transport system substrate-binding protein